MTLRALVGPVKDLTVVVMFLCEPHNLRSSAISPSFVNVSLLGLSWDCRSCFVHKDLKSILDCASLVRDSSGLGQPECGHQSG